MAMASSKSAANSNLNAMADASAANKDSASLKTLKGYMLTDFKKIQGMYHATVVTDSGRCARLIVSERFGTSGAKKADYIKLFKVRYTHGVDVDYIRLEPESKVFCGTSHFFVDKAVEERYFNSPVLSFEEIESSPTKRRLSASGKILCVSPVKICSTGQYQELKIANDTGKVLSATMFNENVGKTASCKIGSTVTIANVETCLYRDTVRLKSTDETVIKIQQLDAQKVTIFVDGFYPESDHHVIVDKQNNLYTVQAHLFQNLKGKKTIRATVVNSEIIDYQECDDAREVNTKSN